MTGWVMAGAPYDARVLSPLAVPACEKKRLPLCRSRGRTVHPDPGPGAQATRRRGEPMPTITTEPSLGFSAQAIRQYLPCHHLETSDQWSTCSRSRHRSLSGLPSADVGPRRTSAPGERPRRRFGRVRELPSGRFQAGYITPDGTTCRADTTFPSRAAAERWLSVVETDLWRGEWVDPRRPQETVGEWASRWFGEGHSWKPKTRADYEMLLRTRSTGSSGPRMGTNSQASRRSPTGSLWTTATTKCGGL
jgi:hypothetical protein